MSDHDRTLTLAQWRAFGEKVDGKCFADAAHNRATKRNVADGHLRITVIDSSEEITFRIDDPFMRDVLDRWVAQQDEPIARTDAALQQALWDSMREVLAVDRRRGLDILEAPGVMLAELAKRGYAVVPIKEPTT